MCVTAATRSRIQITSFPVRIHQNCTSWVLDLCCRPSASSPVLSGILLPCSTCDIWLQVCANIVSSNLVTIEQKKWKLMSSLACSDVPGVWFVFSLSWRWRTVRNVLHGTPLKSHWTQYQIHRPVGATGSIANNINKPQAPILKLAN